MNDKNVTQWQSIEDEFLNSDLKEIEFCDAKHHEQKFKQQKAKENSENLFVDSERCGETAAIPMSLISTYKANKINPNKYLKDISGRINSHLHKRLAELLPQNRQADQK